MSDLLNSASLVMIPSGYKEDVVYSQIPTDGSGDLSFTRASNGTRVNSAGLVEVAPWNLFGNSEDGTSGKWGNEYNIASVTLNSTTAPNGTNTGNLVVENSVNGTHWFEQSFSAISGTPYTISVYFKAKERTQCVLFGFADNGVFVNQIVIFDLSTGAVVSQSGTQTNSIENVGNGWYRCSMTLTAGASATGYWAYGLANGGNNSYQGNGTSGLYMWGRQLNTGTLKPYFPTTDRLNVPRLTYQNGGGGCPSLLLEKQSTNLVVQSNDMTTWTNGAGTMTKNATTSPDGTNNALSFDNTADCSTFVTASNGVYSWSLYIKQGTSAAAAIDMSDGSTGDAYASFTFSSKTFSTSSSGSWSNLSTSYIECGNGWFRITLTATKNAGSSIGHKIIATGSGYTYVYGAQLEASSYPTSYIPTTSSSATRVVDICSKTGISSLIGQSEGVLFADVNIGQINVATDRGIISVGVSGAGYTSAIYVSLYNNDVYLIAFVGGTPQFTGISKTIPSTGRYKIAVAYKQNDFVMYINGEQIGTRNTGNIPTTLSVFGIGNINTGFYGDFEINQSVIFPTRLTNAELASLTTI